MLGGDGDTSSNSGGDGDHSGGDGDNTGIGGDGDQTGGDGDQTGGDGDTTGTGGDGDTTGTGGDGDTTGTGGDGDTTGTGGDGDTTGTGGDGDTTGTGGDGDTTGTGGDGDTTGTGGDGDTTGTGGDGDTTGTGGDGDTTGTGGDGDTTGTGGDGDTTGTGGDGDTTGTGGDGDTTGTGGDGDTTGTGGDGDTTGTGGDGDTTGTGGDGDTTGTGGDGDTTGTGGDGDTTGTGGDGDTTGTGGDGDTTGTGGDGDTTGTGGDGDTTGTGGDGDSTDIEQFCSGQGPVIKIPTGQDTTDVCTGTVARRVFKNAICSCENVAFAGALDTTSFSSMENTIGDDGKPVIHTGYGGNVGVNGSINSAGAMNIGGNFRINGALKLTDEISLPNLNAGAFWAHGNVEANKQIWLAGALVSDHDIYSKEGGLVAGLVAADHLYTPANTPFLAALPILNWETKDFDLEEPCPCQPNEILDVAAIVDQGKLHNDNANPAFNRRAFKVLGPVEALEIPCGRYYLGGDRTWDVASLGIGAIYIRVTGRAALYVDGDLIVTGALWFDLAPGAELDLFIKGNLVLTGATAFGNVTRPADFRVYVGGKSELTNTPSSVILTGAQLFGANLYAPNSFINSEGAMFVRGSIFGKNIHADAAIHVDYDRDILEQGDDDACLPPTDECSNACDELCGSQSTCVNGSCGLCDSDADCCAPLVCYEDGVCRALPTD